jgi:hypothetical protein
LISLCRNQKMWVIWVMISTKMQKKPIKDVAVYIEVYILWERRLYHCF